MRGATPNSVRSLLLAIKECSRSKHLRRGEKVHSQAIASGLSSNVYIASSLVNMYFKCGLSEAARQVFDKLPFRDVVCWNSLMIGYAENGESLMALELLARMEAEQSCQPDALTFVAAAKACIGLARKEDARLVEGGTLVKLVSLDKAMGIHARAAELGNLDRLDLVGSIFIDMYAKCGSLVDARRTFDRLISYDVVSWTALILGHAETGQPSLALELFWSMPACGCSANARTIVAALKACTNMDEKPLRIEHGRRIHLQSRRSGFDKDLYVACSLINMYAGFGRMTDAQQVVDKLEQPDVICWNALISGYANNAEEDLALKLFDVMPVERDHATFSAALNACVSLASKEQATYVDGRALKLASLWKGVSIHRKAAAGNLEGEVAEALIAMYARCGSLAHAHRVFDREFDRGFDDQAVNSRSAPARAALMSAYVENGEPEKALELLFHGVQSKEQFSYAGVLVAAFKACIALAEQEVRCEVDGRLVRQSCLEICDEICSRAGSNFDPYVACTLVSLYSKCGSMTDARKVFDSISHPDVALWNSLMAGYVENGEGALALEVYASMKARQYQPDKFTYSAALNACAALAVREQETLVDGRLVKLQSLNLGMEVHSQAAQAQLCDVDLYVGSSLVSMYGKCRCFEDAWSAFVRMKVVDVVLMTCMILASVETGEVELALRLFSSKSSLVKDAGAVEAALKVCMVLSETEAGKNVEGHHDTGTVKLSSLEQSMKLHSGLEPEVEQSVANSLVEMYCRCGSMPDARAVFDRMEKWNLASWTVLMTGYVENGQGDAALDLYLFLAETQQQVLDADIMAAALTACSLLVALQPGKAIHAEVCRRGAYDSGDQVLLASLVDFYGKCGCMESARRVLDSVPTRDPVVWSSLLAAYSRHGKPEHVFQLLEAIQQENVALNSSGYASILSACSHAGLVSKGKSVFREMQVKLKPGLEHYSCMVDMLSRANQVEKALSLVRSMPYQANAEIWRSMLSASCKYGNTSVAETAFNALLKIDPKDAAAYVLFSSPVRP